MTARRITDTPGPVVSLASMDVPGKPEHPLVVALPGGRRITFRDPGDLSLEELAPMMQPVTTLTVEVIRQRLGEWLSSEDLADFLAIKPSLGQVVAVMVKAQQHYAYLRAFLEASGEGRA